MAESTRYNYFQPIYFEYTEALTKDITGWVMSFPNLEKFKLHYGEDPENAPTDSLLDVLRLLLPQIRVINTLTKDGQPNPAAFLAYEPIDAKILSLIFSKWVEVWYPESKHKQLKFLCTPNQFEWKEATQKDLEWWAPAWAIAKILSEQEYKLGDNKFKLLFGPATKNSTNTVELVSSPPFTTSRGYKSSLGIVISTQSDLNNEKRINLHFSMKRWLVKRGDKENVSLQAKTTHCYVRRLTSWLGDYDLLQPNAFTILEAKNFKNENGFERRWKDKKILDILEKLSVEIPEVEDVLANPSTFIETDKTDILIPARSWQKAGWGTGFTIVDTRLLLRQIIESLPSGVSLTNTWRKIPSKNFTKKLFIKQPKKLFKPKANNDLPDIPESYKEFLSQRVNELTLYVCTATNSKTKDAIEQVVNHYFGDSLKLNFISLQGLADPIIFRKSKKTKSPNKRIPQLERIEKFGEIYKQDNPTPIIVEILPQDHPSYKGDADPKSYLKSELPKYNLISQCIVFSQKVDEESKEITSDQQGEGSILNRALSAILDAIMPFDQNYPLSTSEDNNAYAGFYVISRNKATSNQPFHEPVLVVIYKNEIKVLLPAQDKTLRSLPEAICYLAKNPKNQNRRDENTVNTMLEQLSMNYSNADNIYLYVHAQNARRYWTWLQDKNFDAKNSPTEKITIIRVRDLERNEVAEGYGLPVAEDNFGDNFQQELASFAQGIFIAPNSNLKQIPPTETILSVAQKASTNHNQKYTSRFVSYSSNEKNKNPDPSVNWKASQPRAHNILATPSPENFILHHAIAHRLRSAHWWSPDECEYPLPLSLARKIKEWCFSD